MIQGKPTYYVRLDFRLYSVTAGCLRAAKVYNAYICLCVGVSTCFELASDLTKETLLAVFRNLLSRRDRCNHVYSACGSNFLGAALE